MFNSQFLQGTNLFIGFIASVLIWLMVLLIFFQWLFQNKFKNKQVLYILLSGIVSWVAVEIFKRIVGESRPFVQNGNPPLTLTIPHDGSFPSAHAAFAFAVAIALWLKNKRLGYFYILIAVLIGVGRILGNVHYPVDILGGIVLGTFVALALEKYFF